MYAMSFPAIVYDGISAVGPVYPVFIFGVLFQAAITLFWLLQKMFSIVSSPIDESEFLDRLRGWNQRFARIALLTGFAGTYIGIAMSIGPLKEVVSGTDGTAAVTNVMSSLQNAFMSTLAGILIGSLWAGELNDFLLETLKRSGRNKDDDDSHGGGGSIWHKGKRQLSDKENHKSNKSSVQLKNKHFKTFQKPTTGQTEKSNEEIMKYEKIK